MGLVLPSVGVTIGPTWASELNAALEAVDAHDHTPGNGVTITPEAITIDSALPFNGNAAGTVGRVELVSQAATTVLPCNVYVVSGDLWYTNASGTAVQLTIGGSPAAGGGSISGMTGTTASAAYNNATKAFEWNQASGLRAVLDAGAMQLRQAGSSTAASVTLSAPTSGVTSYTLTLPATAPATVSRFLFTSPAGASSWVQPDASTVEVSGTTLQVKALGIGTAQLAALSVTTAKIAAGAVGTSQIAFGAVTGGISGTSPLGPIAYRTIATENIAELAVTGAKIDAGTITSTNLANNAVTLGKIATGAVNAANLVTDAVTTVKITDLNVTTAKLADASVTAAKMATDSVRPVSLQPMIDGFSYAGGRTLAVGAATTIASVPNIPLETGALRIYLQPRDNGVQGSFTLYSSIADSNYIELIFSLTGAATKTWKIRGQYSLAAFQILNTPVPFPCVIMGAITVAGTYSLSVSVNVVSTNAGLLVSMADYTVFVEQGG
jgi:hypothetical protein